MHVIESAAVIDVVVVTTDLVPQQQRRTTIGLIYSLQVLCEVSPADRPYEAAGLTIPSSKMSQCHTYLSCIQDAVVPAWPA